jgi:HAMP domain-containing protein
MMQIPAETRPIPSLRLSFTRALLALFAGAIIFASVITYVTTRGQMYDEAKRRLGTLTDMIASTRKFVREENTDALLAQDIWHASAVSPIVAAKSVAQRFQVSQPDILIHFVSDNPLNPQNLPTDIERGVITRYRAGERGSLDFTGDIGGRTFLLHSTEEIVKANCLACHGTVAKAPKAQAALYKGPSGYGWRVDEVIGATVIGVPVENVESATLSRLLTILPGVAVLFAIFYFVLNALLERQVLRPIIAISQAAAEVSRSRATDSLEMPVVPGGAKEIVELRNAFQRILGGLKYLRDRASSTSASSTSALNVKERP